MCSFNICLPVTQQSEGQTPSMVRVIVATSRKEETSDSRTCKGDLNLKRLAQTVTWSFPLVGLMGELHGCLEQNQSSTDHFSSRGNRAVNVWTSALFSWMEVLTQLWNIWATELLLDQFNSDRIANHSQRSGRSLSVWVSLNIVLVFEAQNIRTSSPSLNLVIVKRTETCLCEWNERQRSTSSVSRCWSWMECKTAAALHSVK